MLLAPNLLAVVVSKLSTPVINYISIRLKLVRSCHFYHLILQLKLLTVKNEICVQLFLSLMETIANFQGIEHFVWNATFFLKIFEILQQYFTVKFI